MTLITYVWPLMFVMASEVLDTGRLRALAICGGVIAFAGSAMLILGTGSGAVTAGRVMGYVSGLIAGLSWVVYSLMLKRGGKLGSDAWPRTFTLAAIGAGLCHLALGPVALTFEPRAVAVAAAIGMGPYGIAFIAWAYGVAKGPSRTVGTVAYGVPVVATALLASIGATELTRKLFLGAALVIGGIVIASREEGCGARFVSLIPRRPRRTAP